MDWKTWCRLCANIEVSEAIEPDVQKIAEQLFEMPSNQAFICLDCKAYVQDLNSFVLKARKVKDFFEVLELADDRDTTIDFLLDLRQSFDLSVPEIEFIEETERDLIADMNEIESFNIEEDEETAESVQDESVEYLIETEIIEPEIKEPMECEDLFREANTSPKSISESFDEEIVNFEDDGLIFEEVTMDNDESIIVKNQEYEDNVASHFEFRCHICSENFKKMYFLTTHTRTVHNCFPRVVCKCGKTIGSTKTLIEHYENHIAYSANFRCNYCDKNYKTQTHYNNHIMTHHQEAEDKKFVCECGKGFKEQRHLTVHRNSHLPDELKFIHPCEFCDKRYSSVFSLRQHIKHIHVKDLNLKCDYCEKTFSRKANLDSHVSHVHTMERKYSCDICELKVKTKSILRIHKKIHSTNPDDILPCDYCDKEFKTQNQLINHMVCHSNIKKHKCSYCTAEYKRSKELSCHIASVHINDPKYKCKYCSKLFNNNSNLRKHNLRIHRYEICETVD